MYRLPSSHYPDAALLAGMLPAWWWMRYHAQAGMAAFVWSLLWVCQYVSGSSIYGICASAVVRTVL